MAKVKAVKGCINEACIAYKSKLHFKDSDQFCPKCGNPLYYVCKRCGKQLPDNSRKYCLRCENDIKDQHDEWGKVLAGSVQNKVKKAGKAVFNAGKQATKTLADTTNEIKENAVKFVDDTKKSLDNQIFHFPEEYKKIIHHFQKGELAFPMGNPQMFEMKTSESYGLLIYADVTDRDAMPFDDDQGNIDYLHKCAEDGEKKGIITAKHGITEKGNRFVYFIYKESTSEDDSFPSVLYNLNMNVEFNGKIKFINACFREAGTTGVRDSVIYATFMKKYDNVSEAMEYWIKDPYDANFKEGFLMNCSEQDIFDDSFAEHPLSKCRELVKYIIKNN